MNTTDLPQEIDQLKRDLNRLLVDFNKKTNLDISEIHAAAIPSKALDGSTRAIAYDVSVGIDL